MSTEANKSIVRRFIQEVVNGGNLAFIDEIASPDFVEHAAPPGFPATREAIHRIIGMQRTAFPDLHSTEEDLLAEGDRVVYRGRLRGTHNGPLMGMPPTGKSMAMDEIHIIRLAAGKLIEHWALFDLPGMFQQLGVSPSPAAAGH